MRATRFGVPTQIVSQLVYSLWFFYFYSSHMEMEIDPSMMNLTDNRVDAEIRVPMSMSTVLDLPDDYLVRAKTEISERYEVEEENLVVDQLIDHIDFMSVAEHHIQTVRTVPIEEQIVSRVVVENSSVDTTMAESFGEWQVAVKGVDSLLDSSKHRASALMMAAYHFIFSNGYVPPVAIAVGVILFLLCLGDEPQHPNDDFGHPKTPWDDVREWRAGKDDETQPSSDTETAGCNSPWRRCCDAPRLGEIDPDFNRPDLQGMVYVVNRCSPEEYNKVALTREALDELDADEEYTQHATSKEWITKNFRWESSPTAG